MNTNKLAQLVANSKKPKSKIAEEIGITRMTLDNAIQGGDIRLSILEAIARAFNVPVGYFFDDTPIVSADHHSAAAVGGNASVGADAMITEKVKYLEEQNALLREMLEEKERLIKVYEKMAEK